ncbi:MAG: FkbM family methyltransferase [Desulfovibrio sp.]|nr:FkbM family methyltransferase [Desulfovibrio sp.]
METFNDIVKQTERVVKTLGSRWLKDAWQHEEEIGQVLALLSDAESRDVYSREIMWCFLHTFLKGQLAATMARMMTQATWLASVEETVAKNIHPEIEAPASALGTLTYSKTATFTLGQYRYADKVGVEAGDTCLDLGACLGDTSLWMLDEGASRVHAFEIDPTNREHLARTLAKKPEYGRIEVVPKAVTNTREPLYLLPNAYNPGATCISRQKPAAGQFTTIECTTLDDYCRERAIRPDFIKMDIEGAELDAINGAEAVFTQHRPKFAICIYHSTEHRWQIPLRLAEFCPDYEFYVKKSHPVFETVFYGRPKNG